MLTAIAIATSTADAQTPPTAPAPTDLTATFSGGVIVLSWTAPQGVDVDGYQIRRRLVAPGNKLAPIVPDTGDSETSYTDTDITEPGTYAYRVRAIVDGETGRNTSPVTVEVSESDIQRNVLTAELARLKEALAKHHDGCAIYEVDGPNGKTYAVDTANAQCVSLRELATIHCIPQLDIARIDETPQARRSPAKQRGQRGQRAPSPQPRGLPQMGAAHGLPTHHTPAPRGGPPLAHLQLSPGAFPPHAGAGADSGGARREGEACRGGCGCSRRSSQRRSWWPAWRTPAGGASDARTGYGGLSGEALPNAREFVNA